MGLQLRVLCPESIGLSSSHTNLITDFFSLILRIILAKTLRFRPNYAHYDH